MESGVSDRGSSAEHAGGSLNRAVNPGRPFCGLLFFQNLTAFQVGYFTVNPDAGEGSIDWAWLSDQGALKEDGCVRHLRFDAPMRVVMNSRTRKSRAPS